MYIRRGVRSTEAVASMYRNNPTCMKKAASPSQFATILAGNYPYLGFDGAREQIGEKYKSFIST